MLQLEVLDALASLVPQEPGCARRSSSNLVARACGPASSLSVVAARASGALCNCMRRSLWHSNNSNARPACCTARPHPAAAALAATSHVLARFLLFGCDLLKALAAALRVIKGLAEQVGMRLWLRTAAGRPPRCSEACVCLQRSRACICLAAWSAVQLAAACCVRCGLACMCLLAARAPACSGTVDFACTRHPSLPRALLHARPRLQYDTPAPAQPGSVAAAVISAGRMLLSCLMIMAAYTYPTHEKKGEARQQQRQTQQTQQAQQQHGRACACWRAQHCMRARWRASRYACSLRQRASTPLTSRLLGRWRTLLPLRPPQGPPRRPQPASSAGRRPAVMRSALC